MNKKQLSERDICTKFITPALKQAGWNIQTQIREEVYFTNGRIYVRGSSTARGKRKFADYILYYRPNIPIAVIEAKDNNHSVGAGMQQGIDFAEILDIPCVFSSNGDGFVFHDRSADNVSEQELTLEQFPGDAQRIEQLGWMLFLKIFSDKDKELELMDDAYKSSIPAEYHWDEWAGNDEGITGDELLHFVNNKLFPALRKVNVASGNKRALIVREVFQGNNNYMQSGTALRNVINKLNQVDFNIANERHLFGDIYEGILKELQSAGKSGEFYTPRAVTQFMTDIINPQLGEKLLDPACGTGGFLACAVEHLKAQATNVQQRQSIQENVAGWEFKPLPYLLATTNLILHDIEVPSLLFDDSLARPLTDHKAKDRVDVILANPPFGGAVANNNENNFPLNFRTKESADLFLILMIHLLKPGGRAAIVLPDGSLTGDGVKQRIREKWLTDCNVHTIVRLPNSVFAPYASVATNLCFFEKGTPTKDIWYYEHKLPEGQKSYSKTKPIRIEEFDAEKAWWNKRSESDIAWKVSAATIKERNYDLDIKNPHREEEEIPHTAGELLDMLEASFAKSTGLIQQLRGEF